MVTLNYHALLRHAHASAEAHDFARAKLIAEDLLSQNKNDPQLLSLLAYISTQCQEIGQAMKYLNRCIALQPKEPWFHVELALLHSRQGEYAKAIVRFEKALRLAPHNARAIGGLSDTLERAGEFSKARQLLEPRIASQKDDALMAMVWARLALNEKNPEEAVRAMSRHLESTSFPTAFFFVLGQAYERIGELERAYSCYRTGNTRPHLKFNLESFVKSYGDLITTYTPELLTLLPRPAHETKRPIFIAGRPRSGTTLIEKILDSHPDVVGVGELPQLGAMVENLANEIGSILPYPQCLRDLDRDDVNRLSQSYLDHLRQLAPKGRRTVDKNLVNFQHLGLIQILFPEAHVIHIRRAAIDNCWAIFVADMAYGWTADLRSIGITHSLYQRIMQHWHDVLTLPILDVDYESLVDDQEGWTRRILEFCGLPWNDRCLRFYEAVGGKKDLISAPTLSYNQVRQPIYRSAVGRAEKFEPFLGDLRSGLSEGARIASELGVQK